MRSAATHLGCVVMVATPLTQGHACVWLGGCNEAATDTGVCQMQPLWCLLPHLPQFRSQLPGHTLWFPAASLLGMWWQGAGDMLLFPLGYRLTQCFQSPSSLCAGAPGTVWLVSGQVICPKAELVKHRSSDWDKRTCPGMGGRGRNLKPLIKPCFLFLSFSLLPPSLRYCPNLTESTIFLPLSLSHQLHFHF